MAITRHATARWEGDLKSGRGRLDTPQSGLFAGTRYGFNSRFGEEKGTNPEELIAAAHAGCFAMALSAMLTEAGHPPTSLDTRADVQMSMEGGPHITQIRLSVRGDVPGLDAAAFRDHAEMAKANCPISKVLASVPITLDVQAG
jgi:osmotically inducible protein OsmC